MTEFPSDSLVDGTIDGILSRAEFQPRGKGLSDYIAEKLAELFEMLFDAAGGAYGAPFAILIGLAVFLILLTVFLVLRVKRMRKLNGGKNGQGQTGRMYGGAELWQAAMGFAERGEFNKALICLFLSHLRSLEACGLIAIEKSKTNIQYEQELMQNGYAGLREFREFKNLFNAARYGYLRVDAETFGLWRAYCLEAPVKEDAA